MKSTRGSQDVKEVDAVPFVAAITPFARPQHGPPKLGPPQLGRTGSGDPRQQFATARMKDSESRWLDQPASREAEFLVLSGYHGKAFCRPGRDIPYRQMPVSTYVTRLRRCGCQS
jgi:hypothetical protein